MKSKVVIAWGTVDGKVLARFMKSMIDLIEWERENPSPEYELLEAFYVGGLYTENNRNMIVEEAEKLGADWLLQIDADESFPNDLLRKIMRTANAETRPIVVGLYANVGNIDPSNGAFSAHDCLYAESENGDYRIVASPDSPAPFQVDASGTGVMLTHMSVFKKIAYPWFWLEHIHVKGQEHPQMMNEDIAFCRKARDAGYKIWCDPIAEVTHWKTVPLVASSLRRFLIKSMNAKEGMQFS